MRARTLVVAWLLGIAPALSAQGAPAAATLTPAAPRVITLEDALALAAGSSEAIGIAKAGVQRADGQVAVARSGWLPQFNGFGSYTRTIKTQFEGLFGSTTGGASSGTGGFPLGQPNTYAYGVSASQTLYNGRLPGQVRAANAGRDRAEVEVAAQRAQLTLDVTRAYFDAALADRLLQIAESTLAQTERTLGDVQVGRQVGTQSEFERLRAAVGRDNQRPVVIQRRAQRDLAFIRLRQLLNLQGDAPLSLATALDEDVLDAELGVRPTATDTSSALRNPVRQAMLSLRNQEGLAATATGEALPTVTVSSTLQRIAFGAELFGFDRSVTDWNVVLRLDVPLFTGGRIRGDRAQAAASVTEARLRVEQARKQAGSDARDALTALESAESAWRSSAGTVEQAAKAYAIAEVRFREGISTQTELSDSRLQLEQARANRAQAARDLKVARTRVALLPELPVGAAVATTGSAR